MNNEQWMNLYHRGRLSTSNITFNYSMDCENKSLSSNCKLGSSITIILHDNVFVFDFKTWSSVTSTFLFTGFITLWYFSILPSETWRERYALWVCNNLWWSYIKSGAFIKCYENWNKRWNQCSCERDYFKEVLLNVASFLNIRIVVLV